MHVLDWKALYITQGKVGKRNSHTKRLQSSMCPIYEENMEKVVVMSRDHR